MRPHLALFEGEDILEYIDIRTGTGRRTGRTVPRGTKLGEGEYFLAVAVVVRAGLRWFVTRRSPQKTAPLFWEFPGGGVQAGEDSADAILREIQEETGLDVSKAEGGLLFSYRRENIKEGDNYFVDVYRFTMDFTEADVTVQQEEVKGFEIAGPAEIEKYGKDGIFLHYDSIRQAFK